jgi:hypothetical protein
VALRKCRKIGDLVQPKLEASIDKMSISRIFASAHACVALIMIPLNLEAGGSSCALAKLELSPPINWSEWDHSCQDYAEYNSVVENAYHTGIDYSGVKLSDNKGPSVLAAADGCIVELQVNSDEDDDHGWGNTVVIKHVIGNSTYYTQYSHL